MRRPFLLLFFTCLLSATAENLGFRRYTVESGLTYNTVTSIIQDDKGFVWLGTENGLNRFDGYTFKEYRTPAEGEKPMLSNLICCLMKDNSGNIWLGTDIGLYILNTSSERISRFAQTVEGVDINTTVNNIVKDQNDNIWVSTAGQGVFCYNTKSKKLEQYNILIEGSNSIRFDDINHVYVDKHNQVWVAPKSYTNPILVFERSTGHFKAFPLKDKNISIYKIFEDSQQNLWLGTWNRGICKLNKTAGTITSFLSPDKPGGILHVHDINEYKPGILLVGSDDGLSMFNIATQKHDRFLPSELDPTSISDKFIYPIFKDHEGGFWIGTYFGGANYLSPNSSLFGRFSHSRYNNSVSGNVVGRFVEDKKGNIWIATDDGGLNVFNTSSNRFTAYLPRSGSNSISYHNVHALCWDDDLLWIGTYAGGLNVLNTKTGRFKLYNYSDKNPRTLDGGSIYAIFMDREKRVWVTTMSGVNLYNRATDDFTRIKRLNVTTIDIKQDKKGNIWFATQGKGMYRLEPATGRWKNYNSTQGDIPGNQVNSIAFDQQGTMWVGTSAGLCVYSPETDQFKTVSLQIPSQVICCVIPATRYLWLTTAKGLVRYTPNDHSCQIFTCSDGLLSDQFIVNSGIISSKGVIYVGSANGFNSFDPGKLILNKKIPTVAITGLEIFNKETRVGENILNSSIESSPEIHLSYKDNVFSIRFTALSFFNPEKNSYAYKLEGFDKDWNVVSHQNKATYTNLPAGEYTFKVKASNSDGVWNEEGTQIKIIIHPPLWLSPFFKFVYFILFILSIVAIIKYMKFRTDQKHRNQIKELNQQKETEVYNAKIQFFTMVAHEIRTPVSLIIGPLEKILVNCITYPKEVVNDLNIIERNSQRLLQLVNQLLDFRKVEQGSMTLQPTRQNIHRLLNNVYERFLPNFQQKNILPRFDCPDKQFEAVVDQEALTKSVSNLLTNALKYTHDSVILSCRINRNENSFEIKVEDNGVGIADDEKEKVFNPFYQIPGNSKQGTGIGLSLVKSIVEAHLGRIEIQDAPLSGAVFKITLPLDSQNSLFATSETSLTTADLQPEENLESDAVLPVEAPSSPLNAPVLLVVEDNEDMREFLYQNFRADYDVIVAADGVEGAEWLKTREVNLIISDLMMPNMDGMELCKVVRTNPLYSHIPFVMLTAKTDLESKIEGLNYGADSYIEKPFSIHYIKAQINNLLESRKMLRKKFSEMPFTPISTIAGNSSDEQFLIKMNEIIEQNISNETFSIDQLAEALYISRSGLFAKIKNLAGVTPNELIQLIRLKKAAEYISKKEHRINEIAYLVGFNNPSYFSKCFQKQFGLTPKEFEKQNK